MTYGRREMHAEFLIPLQALLFPSAIFEKPFRKTRPCLLFSFFLEHIHICFEQSFANFLPNVDSPSFLHLFDQPGRKLSRFCAKLIAKVILSGSKDDLDNVHSQRMNVCWIPLFHTLSSISVTFITKWTSYPK